MKKKKASMVRYGDYVNEIIDPSDINESYMDQTPFKNDQHARIAQEQNERQISSQNSQPFT